jgi:hypothetical protein
MQGQGSNGTEPLFSQEEVVKCLTPAGTLICTLTSNGYKFYTLNLVRHLQEIRAPWRLAIFCTDAAAATFLRGEGIPCIRLQQAPRGLDNAATAPAPFGSRQFQLMNRRKLDMLAGVTGLEAVKQVIYIDGDIAVYRDFVPDMEERLTTAPDTVLMQCDARERVDCSGTICPNRCTGFFAWSTTGVAAMRDVLRLSGSDAEAIWRECPEDQPFVNKRLAAAGVPVISLPRGLYPNGAYASLLKKGGIMREVAMLLHYNYLVGDSKKGKMRINGDWLLPY